jgi:hypothetical protein
MTSTKMAKTKLHGDERKNQRARRRRLNLPARVLSALLLCGFLLSSWSRAGQLPGNRWDLLAIAYPPGREIAVNLGGAEKTLTSSGAFKVKAKADSSALEIEIKNLPSPGEVGWTGRQYVLWALDREKRVMNLGLVPVRGKGGKWSVQIPFRVFGLMVTAEQDPKAPAPSEAVAMESLLPIDPDIVVPVYRVEVALAQPKS